MIEPLGDHVAVRVSEEAEMRNGLVIPDAMRKKPNEGVVVAAGPGRMTEMGLRPAIQVRVGDLVLYQGGHFKATVDGEELLILREHEIVAVLERAERPHAVMVNDGNGVVATHNVTRG